MSNHLMDIFQDTQNYIWDNKRLCKMTEQLVHSTQVFPERFETTRVVGSYATTISVTSETTFQAAKRLKESYVKVGVLNFANAVNPGGGVAYGARAQEEDLCRCSNLYASLIKPEIYENFYGYNNQFSPFYTDRVIYSPDITVFKTEGPEYQYMSKWFQTDVLTCPAPNLNGIEQPDYQKLGKIYANRIHNILAVAEAHGIQALVLGAFGCGAFLNPPELMAKAFYDELMFGDYKDSFREIVFAIKATSPQGEYNLKVFQKAICPWQANPLYGKKVSILGDGISTYWRYNPKGYPVFYMCGECVRTGLYDETDTWWMKLLEKMQARLLINNSCLGSCVSGNDTFSGNNDNRLSRLYTETEVPEVILVAMGMSDYEQGVSLEAEVPEEVRWDNYYYYFKSSYEMMLWKLRQYFPEAEIYCATLSYGAYGGNTNHLFAEGIYGIPLSRYNQVIRKCANEYGCRVVDIARKLKHYESIDGIHPTAAGMCQLADAWERAINHPESTLYVRRKRGKSEWLVMILSIILVVLLVILAILLVME